MQDFGQIKTTFNEILIEGLIKKQADSKKLFKKYLKTIKESEILRTQFLVYNNIENRIEKDRFSAWNYMNENLKLLKKFSTSDIIRENEKLSKLLPPNKVKPESNKLHEALGFLLTAEVNPSNMDNLSDNVTVVLDHIVNNTPKVVNERIDLPNSFLISTMVQKYNEKYSTIEAEDKEILNTLINADLTDKQSFYTNTVTECLDIVNKLLENTQDYQESDKLNKVKAKLLAEEVVKEDQFMDKIIKLIELKNNLS